MPPSRGHTAEQTSDDHANVKENDNDTVKGGQTGQEGERDEQEGGGEEPVNVACISATIERMKAGKGGVSVTDWTGMRRTYGHSRPDGRRGAIEGPCRRSE